MLSGCLLVEYGRDATIRVGVITNGVSTDQSAPTPWCRRSTSPFIGAFGWLITRLGYAPIFDNRPEKQWKSGGSKPSRPHNNSIT
jgi:hypothetical protein